VELREIPLAGIRDRKTTNIIFAEISGGLKRGYGVRSGRAAAENAPSRPAVAPSGMNLIGDVDDFVMYLKWTFSGMISWPMPRPGKASPALACRFPCMS